MSIRKKTVGMLLDELITINIRSWHAQEIVVGKKDDSEVSKAAKLAQRCNARRSDLIRELDCIFEETQRTIFKKTY